jgi:hypothetical protein
MVVGMLLTSQGNTLRRAFITGSENLQCDNSVFLLQVQRIYSVIILVNVNVNQGLLEINVIGP